VVLGITASNCIVFGEYVLFALRKEPTAFAQKALAVGLLTAVTIMHSCFLKTGIFIQDVLGWVKIGLMVFMVFTSLFVVFLQPHGSSNTIAAPSIQPTFWDSLWSGSVWNWGIISTALFKVFYSYAGLQNVNNVLNEVKNPVKTLKSASTAGLVTACILYLLVNIAYFMIVPIEEIKNSGELIAALFFERIFGPALGRILLPLVVAISAVGNVAVVTFSVVRL
jgi:amino acid transporter